MIEVIAEHSVCVDKLPKKANILDLGARGALFSNHFKSLGHNVFSVDADNIQGITHPNLAIMDFDGFVGINRTSDPQATNVLKDGNDVRCMTVASFSKMVGVKHWDLIKFDIEAGEYLIFSDENFVPFADMLSVEWHYHCNKEMHNKYFIKCMDNLIKYYTIRKHDFYPAHGAGNNFWDCLYIKK